MFVLPPVFLLTGAWEATDHKGTGEMCMLQDILEERTE